MIAVIGLDLSLTATGIAYADGSTTTVKTRAADGDRRLLHIVAAVTEALDPDTCLVVLEDLPTHAHSAGITGMVHGAVRAALLDQHAPYALVPPATLKSYATGRGNADKTAMALEAFKRSGAEFSDDNQCDAAWLRWAGLDWLGAPAFSVPQAQRERLVKVDWPSLRAAA
jgi:Holliday junction resolvasome RuvABC endonuclease subunit